MLWASHGAQALVHAVYDEACKSDGEMLVIDYHAIKMIYPLYPSLPLWGRYLCFGSP